MPTTCIRLGLVVLVIAVASVVLAWGTDSLAVLVRQNRDVPAAVRVAAARIQAAVRSGVPLALAWGLGAGPFAAGTAGATAAFTAAYAPDLSVVLIDQAGKAQGGARELLGLGSALVFLVTPIAGALVGGVTTAVRGGRSFGQRWGLTGGFTMGLAGAAALTLSWDRLAYWPGPGEPARLVGEIVSSLVLLGLVGLVGGFAGAGGVRLGRLMWRGREADSDGKIDP